MPDVNGSIDSFRLDQLERQTIEILDEDGAGVAEGVRPHHDGHARGLQVSDDGIEIRKRERHVIDDLTARPDERFVIPGPQRPLRH